MPLFFSKQKSIRNKVVTLIMGISLLVLLFTCVVFIIYDRISFKQKMVSDMNILGEIIGDSTVAAITFYDTGSASRTLEALKAERQIVVAVLFDEKGNVFADYRRNGPIKISIPDKVGLTGTTFQDDALISFRPIRLDGEFKGTLFLHSDLQALQDRAARYTVIAVLFAALASLIAFLLATRLQKVISLPILDLAAVTRRIFEHGDYSLRAEVKGRDEIGSLTEGFNKMVGQIQDRDAALKKARKELEVRNEELQEQLIERVRAEEALQKAHDELEQRVADRTADLARNNEELNRAKEIAEGASRTKSEFLANMSHELRTPLNHIIGFTELVVDKNFGELNPQQEEFLNDVLQSSRHLLTLINEILDLSKVESGKMDLELSQVYLRPLVENSLVMVKEKALKHRIKFTTEVADQPEAIQADERKLKQILYNLLSNAVKFTPDGGSIFVRVALENGASPGYSGLRFSLIDTGVGLKTQDLERIFEPFEQADNSASRKFQGTGLGLALTKKMVELHGGRVWAESEGEGKGSTFHFVIPKNLQERMLVESKGLN
jgi:signal transduction histidine kinase